jgi:hypothetical protein
VAKFKTYSQQDRAEERARRKNVDNKKSAMRLRGEDTLEFRGKKITSWGRD